MADEAVGRQAGPGDRAEVLADAIVHAVGVLFAAVAVAHLVVLVPEVASPAELAAVLIYGAGLVTTLGVSAAYNLWPASEAKQVLRRIDHSAIYVLIAGTYTPFISQMKSDPLVWFVGLWGVSLAGIALKLCLPGRFDRLSIALYLLIGWSGLMAFDDLSAALPSSTVWLLVAGGILYTVGVLFHLWRSLRFQTSIWHAFVLLAAMCHYGAVLDCMVLTRA